MLFLGSGGARFVVARQLRASGGMWMRFGETQIHVDPGPGALVRALSHVPPCNPRELDAIVLSHKHLDHSGDVNALVEAMTSGGFRRRGMLLAPADAFDVEPVVLPYVRRFVAHVERLEASAGPYRIGGVELRTSIAHVHAVRTYGMHFSYEGLRVAYLPCGRFFDGLASDYARLRPDVLIVNVLRHRDEMNVDHLTWDGRPSSRCRGSSARRDLPTFWDENAGGRSAAARAGSRRRTGFAGDRGVRWFERRPGYRGGGGWHKLKSRASSPKRSPPFYQEHEREALRTLYGFSVVWHEQVHDFAAVRRRPARSWGARRSGSPPRSRTSNAWSWRPTGGAAESGAATRCRGRGCELL